MASIASGPTRRPDATDGHYSHAGSGHIEFHINLLKTICKKYFNLLSSFFNISESKCKPEADESAARAVESVELAQPQRVGHFFHFVSTGPRVCGTEMLRSQ